MRIKDEDFEIKVYGNYVMMDRQGFEDLLRRGRFFGLYSKIIGHVEVKECGDLSYIDEYAKGFNKN
jgi:hypothetical protein